MASVDRFVAITALCESVDNPEAWGDDGRACGRWQIHPSAYASWGPKPADFGGEERSWDWAFESCLRLFYRRAIAGRANATDIAIAMAWHLHGQVRWDGWDAVYSARWLAAKKHLYGEPEVL